MRTLASALILASVVYASQSHAFEDDGFKTGQTRTEVTALLRQRGADFEEKGDLIMTINFTPRYALSFCNGSLYALQKYLPASLPRFVEVYDAYTKRFGHSTATRWGLPDPTVELGQHSLTFDWKFGGDQVLLTYIAFQGGEKGYQLDVYFRSANKCFAPI